MLSVTNMMNEKQTREQRQDSHVLVTHLSFSYMHTISSSRDGLPLYQVFVYANQSKSWFLFGKYLSFENHLAECFERVTGGKLMRKEAVGQLQVCLLF